VNKILLETKRAMAFKAIDKYDILF